MMTITTRGFACAFVLILASSAAAQQPAAPAPAQPGAKPDAAPKVEQPAPAPYSYDPQGRRDPFVSLIARGSDPKSAANRPAGLPGMLINDASVKGIIQDRSGFIAMIQGPNTKTFTVRPGDNLLDGTVKAITADTVVFSQDVNDPLSMVKQKEVRKTIRPSIGGRE
jgi:Tfp pilus assembly protein PilP